jgi:hypothetical protein
MRPHVRPALVETIVSIEHKAAALPLRALSHADDALALAAADPALEPVTATRVAAARPAVAGPLPDR